TFPIDTITVFKNGKAIAEEDYITTTSKNSDIVEVSFQSPTEEFFRESPRGFRFWRGTMEIEGAELVTATAPGFQNPYLEWVRRDENNENLIHFATATRGRTNAILLELKNIAAAARVAIRLEASTERPSTPQQYRRLAKIPGEDVTLLLAGSNKGKQVREFKVDRYTDTIAVRYVNPAVAYDREFEFADDEMMLHGDYYYIRVKQLDGALAWSSPIWVGGVPPT
ncbi:MAG: hypothetical protein QGG73_11100, partial [Candidatus Hydrogenedentes bacterium]|nr:hypothetical protein [Candidatus Hydrogenedentota bacterium]